MENTSNALLMAAGILIGVIIISLGTYLFTTFGGYSKNINERLTQQQKEEFNSQFTKYETDKTTYCTAYDIVTIINLARDANEKYEEYRNTKRPNIEGWGSDNTAYIYVNVNGVAINETSEDKDLRLYIQNNISTDGSYSQYKCKVNISEQTKLVKSITFTKK